MGLRKFINFYAVKDKTDIRNNFHLRAGHFFENYRPIDYFTAPAFSEGVMLRDLDKMTADLLNDNLDAANSDYLANHIFSRYQLAEADIRRQKADHQNIIKRLSIRENSDRLMYEEKLAAVDKDIAALVAALDELGK